MISLSKATRKMLTKTAESSRITSGVFMICSWDGGLLGPASKEASGEAPFWESVDDFRSILVVVRGFVQEHGIIKQW